MLVRQTDGSVREEAQRERPRWTAALARWERRFGGRADAEWEARETLIHSAVGPVGDRSPEEFREAIVREARKHPVPAFRARGGKAGVRYQVMAREVEARVRREVSACWPWRTREWHEAHHPEQWEAIYPAGAPPTFGE